MVNALGFLFPPGGHELDRGFELLQKEEWPTAGGGAGQRSSPFSKTSAPLTASSLSSIWKQSLVLVLKGPAGFMGQS